MCMWICMLSVVKELKGCLMHSPGVSTIISCFCGQLPWLLTVVHVCYLCLAVSNSWKAAACTRKASTESSVVDSDQWLLTQIWDTYNCSCIISLLAYFHFNLTCITYVPQGTNHPCKWAVSFGAEMWSRLLVHAAAFQDFDNAKHTCTTVNSHGCSHINLQVIAL